MFGMGVFGRVFFYSTSMNPWDMPKGGARGKKLEHPNKVEYCSLFIQQPLNKEGWASDMFITSTFSVIR